jgi:hypothetical protein
MKPNTQKVKPTLFIKGNNLKRKTKQFIGSNYYRLLNQQFDSINADAVEIINLITSSIKTVKNINRKSL